MRNKILFFLVLFFVFSVITALAQDTVSPDRRQTPPDELFDRINQIEKRVSEIKKTQHISPSFGEQKAVRFQLLKKIASPGMNPGQLLTPKGLSISSKGIFVANVDNKRIEHFSLDGVYLNSFDDISRDMASKLKTPISVAQGYGDTLWVIDRDNDLCVQYQTSGKYISSFGGLGDEKGKFNEPSGIAIDNKGYLFVADSGNDRIQKFTPNGSFIAAIGSFGHGEYGFDNPTGIAVDKKGYIYVLDQGNKKIKKYNEYFQFVQDISSFKWKKPVSIGIDEKNHIYVVDTYNEKVYIHSTSGEYIDEIAQGLKDPQGVAVRDGLIYITDNKYHQILVYKVCASY